MSERLVLKDVSFTTPSGRALFDNLNLRIEDARVALVGPNGVGKSTLLAILAGELMPTSGQVRVAPKPYFVPQLEGAAQTQSRGEVRQHALRQARRSGAEVLLLDEPSEHLDEGAVDWLREWLRHFGGCLLVASHDRRLLSDFEHFFVVSGSGCHYFRGSLPELEAHLESDHQRAQERYLSNLNRLAAYEEHTSQVARRKARKKRYGRCSELDRATPRILLNQKRDQAQVSHGRLAKLREQRLARLRSWTQFTRRALHVDLPLDLTVPVLSQAPDPNVVALRGVSASAHGRTLFQDLDLSLGRDRIGLVGPNGAGKTTLLEVVLGQRAPLTGSATSKLSKIGSIEQGGQNWLRDGSLLACLEPLVGDLGIATRLLLAHRFPLALAERPLRSLSPGERARAALMCLFARSPSVEVLVLDEPTFSLDLVGLRSLTEALKLWQGGLLVASHDRAFLHEIRVDRVVELSG